MEGIFAVILLLLAVFASLIALTRLRQKRETPQAHEESANRLIPNIGQAGSVQPSQLKRLKELRVEGFDLKRLSKEQATILLDTCLYLLHVWEKEMGEEAGQLQPEVRDRVLRSVLTNDSYLERIIVSEEAHYETREEEIPEDACYWHVVSFFKNAS